MCIWGVRSVHSKGRSGGWGWVGRGSGKSGNAHHGLQPSWWSLTCVILVYFSMEPKNWWWTSYIFIRYSILFPSVFVLELPNLPLRTGDFTVYHHFFTILQLVMWSAEVPAAVVDFREPTCCICYEAEPSVQSMICGHKARRRGLKGRLATGEGGCGWLSFETIMDDSDELMMIMCSRWKVKSHQNQSLCSKFWNIDW